jgi:hypothetical protein
METEGRWTIVECSSNDGCARQMMGVLSNDRWEQKVVLDGIWRIFFEVHRGNNKMAKEQAYAWNRVGE